MTSHADTALTIITSIMSFLVIMTETCCRTCTLGWVNLRCHPGWCCAASKFFSVITDVTGWRLILKSSFCWLAVWHWLAMWTCSHENRIRDLLLQLSHTFEVNEIHHLNFFKRKSHPCANCVPTTWQSPLSVWDWWVNGQHWVLQIEDWHAMSTRQCHVLQFVLQHTFNRMWEMGNPTTHCAIGSGMAWPFGCSIAKTAHLNPLILQWGHRHGQAGHQALKLLKQHSWAFELQLQN